MKYRSTQTTRVAARISRRVGAFVALAAIGFGSLAQDATAPATQRGPVQVAKANISAAAAVPTVRISQATDPKSYRQDAARHLYDINKTRIFKGKMPPLLYAVGVLQVEVDEVGQVASINWMRAPSHVPAVMTEIEGLVRAAAPFPVPAQMGRVVYTDIWLWHRSGRFQLDTLTEGQL